MRATDVLRDEHEVIQQVLDCVEELARRAESKGSLDVALARRALEFLQVFADRCHHGKEEDLLFPALNARGLPRHVGPVAVMLDEHVQGRLAIANMVKAVDAAERGLGADSRSSDSRSSDSRYAVTRFAAAAHSYVDLLREHIAKENGVLFPMADQMLGDQAELMRAFQTMEHQDMGVGTHEHFLELARDLCAKLDIAWMPHATAAHACCGGHTSCDEKRAPASQVGALPGSR